MDNRLNPGVVKGLMFGALLGIFACYITLEFGHNGRQAQKDEIKDLQAAVVRYSDQVFALQDKNQALESLVKEKAQSVEEARANAEYLKRRLAFEGGENARKFEALKQFVLTELPATFLALSEGNRTPDVLELKITEELGRFETEYREKRVGRMQRVPVKDNR